MVIVLAAVSHRVPGQLPQLFRTSHPCHAHENVSEHLGKWKPARCLTAPEDTAQGLLGAIDVDP